MQNISEIYQNKKYTSKVIQFGEGNFLRCFVDWQIDQLNEKTDFDAGIIVVRPIDSDFPPSLNIQNGLYTAILRGLDGTGSLVKEYRVIKSINSEISVYHEFDKFLNLAADGNFKYIFSNTTEAGICFNPEDKFSDAPPSSFPAKLTRLLYERYRIFCNDKTKGFIIIPCELIDYNGQILKEIIFKYADLWKLEDDFKEWLEETNTFCSTLVDRIVTGYPKDEKEEIEKELGYTDNFMVTGEYFHLFVIQGPEWLKDEFHLDQVNLNIRIVEDILPYKTRKVGVLNGAHTIMVPVGFLYGFDTVRECMIDETVGNFVKKAVFDEIIPSLDVDKDELKEFANAVIDRFKNPYVRHQLLSISLNSMAKFRTRVLPQILNFRKKYDRLPDLLVFALASMIMFYKGFRNGGHIELKDDQNILELYKKLWTDYDDKKISLGEVANGILVYEKNWEMNLAGIEGLNEKVTGYLKMILENGMKNTLRSVL
ncbi:MAG: tagaturonate reductase [Spirochaetes bacterium]|nr:tagaturonate reductase [Spirochaetota bacterium]